MRRFWTSRNAFWSDRKGSVAILFALALIPVVGTVGAAFDYSIANANRTSLQKALDATALALSRMMPTSQATLDTVGNQYFQANLGTTQLSGLQLSIVPDVGILKLSASGTYQPQIASVLGVNSIPVGAKAEVKWSIGKVEIALALDNTGSMSSSGKLTQLKTATHNLLDVLQAAAKTPGDAKVAIVPFDYVVNIGTAYKNEPWMRYDLLDCNGSSSGHGCGSNLPNAWEGCVTDRDKDPSLNYDVNDTAPTSTNATKYPAVQCGSLVSMMPLTNNWTALHNKVNAMSASGNTNVTIGLVWAWHLLSPTSVFTEGAAYNTENLTKYVIVLTDGDNTQSRFSNTDGGGATSSQIAAINARTALACSNIKAAGIKIYAIRVINGNASLLQNCATNPSMYYNVQNASELSAVFSAIGAEITNLHLSK